MVNVANIANFVYMMQLSYSYNTVNELLKTDKFLNSYEMASLFNQAQLYDSLLIFMNLMMVLMYMKVIRSISKTLGIIFNTFEYLLYLACIYFMVMG
jgi:hypothetical protein